MTDKLFTAYELHDISDARLAGGTINESVSFTLTKVPASSDWQASDGDVSCALSGFVLGNSTLNWTVTSDYVVDTSEYTYTLKNSLAVNTSANNSYAYYYYCDEGYVGDQAAGTAAKLILLFAALGLLGYAVYMFVSESGWLMS